MSPLAFFDRACRLANLNASISQWYEIAKGMLDHDTEKGDIIQTVPGISDAGAHLAIMQDATTPTTMLSHWAVGRTEGTGTLPIETCVKKQARDTVRQSASN